MGGAVGEEAEQRCKRSDGVQSEAGRGGTRYKTAPDSSVDLVGVLELKCAHSNDVRCGCDGDGIECDAAKHKCVAWRTV